jgi:hypothetical protein
VAGIILPAVDFRSFQMARWEIKGAEKSSGAEKVFVVEASNKDAAIKEAGNMGFLIESITIKHEREPAPANFVGDRMGEPANDYGVAEISGSLRLWAFAARVFGAVVCIVSAS